MLKWRRPGRCWGCWRRPPQGQRYCSTQCQILHHCLGKLFPDGCWRWVGRVNKRGYGVIGVRVDGVVRTRCPSRVMYAIQYGEVPETQSVVNICGTKNCCNPKHLQLKVQELQLTRESLAA